MILNEKLSSLMQGIEAVSGLKGVRFAYSMARNRLALKRELETLQEAIKASDKFAEYDKKRIELCEQHADKDEKNKPKMINVGTEKAPREEFVFSKANKVKFDKEVDVLQKENKAILDERDAQLKEFAELLKKESEFKPYMIAYEAIPEDISSSQLSGIIDLVEEPKK